MTTVEIIRNVFRSGFDLRELAWTAWVEPGRIGVEHYTLWAPDGDVEDSVGLLLRFPPGAHGDFHEHLGYELMLVLDGTLEHSDGDDVRARRPRGRGPRHPSPDVEQHRLHRARDPDPAGREPRPVPGRDRPGSPYCSAHSRCLIAGSRSHRRPTTAVLAISHRCMEIPLSALTPPPSHG